MRSDRSNAAIGEHSWPRVQHRAPVSTWRPSWRPLDGDRGTHCFALAVTIARRLDGTTVGQIVAQARMFQTAEHAEVAALMTAAASAFFVPPADLLRRGPVDRRHISIAANAKAGQHSTEGRFQLLAIVEPSDTVR